MYALARPLLFALDAERAHNLTLGALALTPIGRPRPDDPMLATTVAGLSLPNPIGLAAGFDKNALAPDALLALGFGFVETGTVTPRPQEGNPRPRLFRLAADRAVINRMGFNNEGLDTVRTRLWERRNQPGIVGVNVGANRDSADRIADYVDGVRGLARSARYMTINVSSPNTPGLRALQDRAELAKLVAAVINARGDIPIPLFLKVAPDLSPGAVGDIAAVAMTGGIDGLIVGNTTVDRPAGLSGPSAGEEGGLSGAPLFKPSTEMLRAFRKATGGKLPLIGVGGIASGADAYAKIRAGASLVQLYTALVYEGPGLVARIKRDLVEMLRRDGFRRVAEAVGADA